MISQPVIDEAVRLLVADGRPTCVILFGSYARGDAREGSDLDFVVVLPKVASRLSEMIRLRGLLRPLRVLADVLVYSEEQVDAWGDIPGAVCSRRLTKAEPCMPPPEAGPAELLLREAGDDLTRLLGWWRGSRGRPRRHCAGARVGWTERASADPAAGLRAGVPAEALHLGAEIGALQQLPQRREQLVVHRWRAEDEVVGLLGDG